MKNNARTMKTFALAAGLLWSLAGSAQADGLPDFTGIVARYGAAVVNISSTQVVHQRVMPFFPGLSDLPDDDPFAQMFKQLLPQDGESRDIKEHSLGSGFIISPDGVILTNAHVVDGAQQVQVKLPDRREFKARVIGEDKRTDVAVLKINASHLPVVSIGNPNLLKPGQWVLAIGEPFGFENTVTQGIVSATSRSLPSDTLVPFIQTDVPINPGNSGGPLFNLQGQVVGINSQIYSRTGGYMGLSFAIPIDVALNVAHQLRSTGHVVRGRLGVSIQDVSEGLASSFGLHQVQGALIASVEPNSPAAHAGLQPSDIVLRYNGQPVTTASDLQRLVTATRPGTDAVLEVWRKGQVRRLHLRVGKLNDAPSKHPDTQAPHAAANVLGLALTDMTGEERARYKVSHGLLVQHVQGIAGREGIARGDVILDLNDIPLHSVTQFNRLIARYGAGHTVALLVKRGAATIYVPLQIPSKGH
jgi:serine protease Do